ncbi:MAG: hypothetical protein IJJ45_01110 [Clostridia bacterium]|nr:hypothetical protein [Clostridia bacterium]
MEGSGARFDELQFFSRLRAKPGLFLGGRRITGLRDMIAGIGYAFDYADGVFPLFEGFVDWYRENHIKDDHGYAAWWNHLLYANGGRDDRAFDDFMDLFEGYLRDQHQLSLPEPVFNSRPDH